MKMMRSGTGAKARVLKASDINTFEHFKFNRSINPYGGFLSKIKIRTNKKGRSFARIYQDINSNGKISRNELIFFGKSLLNDYSDELINFTGSIRFKKMMHKCDWLLMKYPGSPLMCTMEYIPTIYELILISSSGEKYKFGGTGRFEDHFLK